MTRNETDIHDVIQEITKLSYSIFDKDYTKTSLFILNMLSYRYIGMPVNFVNAYIGDLEYASELEYPIFLLFKTDIAYNHRDKSWVHFEKNLLEHPAYRYMYYAGREDDYDLIMYVFETPELFIEDYLKFLQGKYSEFSEAFKAIFPKITIVAGNPKPALHYKVIEKNPDLRIQIEDTLGVALDDKAELWAKPDYERETFRSK